MDLDGKKYSVGATGGQGAGKCVLVPSSNPGSVISDSNEFAYGRMGGIRNYTG